MTDLANAVPDTIGLPWQRRENLEDAGAELWRCAMREMDGPGNEKRDMAQAATTLYYGNTRHQIGMSPDGGLGTYDILGRELEPTAQNVIQMIVDTMVSLTIKSKVKPFFLTEAGDQDAQDQAQGMMRAVEGIFESEGLYAWLGKMVAKSAYLWDGGFVKVITDYARNKVTLMRVYPWEWNVPAHACKYGPPTEGYHVYLQPRWSLLEDYGYDESEDEETGDTQRTKNHLYDVILTASSAPKEYHQGEERDRARDMLVVVDGYSLASGYVDRDDDASFGIGEDGTLAGEWPWAECGHDGRRIVAIQGQVLHSEPWALETLPVSEFFPMENVEGSYGSRGIPETLAGGQLAVERHSRREDAIINLHAKNTLVVWDRSGINRNKISNDLGGIINSKVQPSQAVAHIPAPPVPPDLRRKIGEIKQDMQAQYGLTPTALYGEKPPGIDHAPGMEHLLEEQNMRHFEPFEAWEQFFMKLAGLVIESCRLLAMRDPDFSVMWGDDTELRNIKWKDFELARKKFTLRRQPTNLLSQTIAMKMKRVTELVNVDPENRADYVAMLVNDYPDTRASRGDTGAARKNISKKLDAIARNGYGPNDIPHPYINLALAKKMAAERINKLEADGNDDAMDEVIKFYEACVQLELEGAAKAATAARGVMPPPLPGATPPSAVGAAPPGAMLQAPPGAPMQ
jgi:hypothetical protein